MRMEKWLHQTEPVSHASVSVLLVDDSAIWRTAVKSMLAGTEFTIVDEAASGDDALEAARKARPQIVLLDIRMPGRDGLETLVALKSEHPNTKVILLTTYDSPAYQSRAQASGAAGYVVKGGGRQDLLASLRAVEVGI